MKVKYLIIGAGISGLTFASNLNDDNYLILEKEDEPGGLCRTIKRNGFVWDYAGHFFHFNNEQNQKYFEEVFNDDKCAKRIKNSKIYYKNVLIDYPFQANIHQLEKEDFIDCLHDLYFKENKERYNSFKDMLYGKFGKGICERFLIPYNEKLYACDLDILDENAMGRFFPYADLGTIIKNMKAQSCSTYNDYFMYPYDGAITIIEHLLKQVNKEKLILNEVVQTINMDEKYVMTSRGKVEYEYLINTMPFNEFARLAKYNVDVSLNCNKVLVLNMGFDKDSINKDYDWIYFPEKDINFYRVGFYNNILDQERMSIYVEIGFKADEQIDIEKQLAETLINLKKCGLIDEHKLLEWCALVMNPAYVHLSSESIEYVNRAKKALEKNNVYSIGRYGGWTYCSMEDCYMMAKDLAKRWNE